MASASPAAAPLSLYAKACADVARLVSRAQALERGGAADATDATAAPGGTQPDLAASYATYKLAFSHYQLAMQHAPTEVARTQLWQDSKHHMEDAKRIRTLLKSAEQQQQQQQQQHKQAAPIDSSLLSAHAPPVSASPPTLTAANVSKHQLKFQARGRWRAIAMTVHGLNTKVNSLRTNSAPVAGRSSSMQAATSPSSSSSAARLRLRTKSIYQQLLKTETFGNGIQLELQSNNAPHKSRRFTIHSRNNSMYTTSRGSDGFDAGTRWSGLTASNDGLAATAGEDGNNTDRDNDRKKDNDGGGGGSGGDGSGGGKEEEEEEEERE